MTLTTILLILASVTISSLAQIMLKIGMSSPRIAGLMAADDRAAVVLGIATQSQVIGGLALYGLGAVLWLFVLAKVEVSVAYPFVGLGFIVAMLFGIFLLGEQASMTRVAGTVLVVAGVLLVGRS